MTIDYKSWREKIFPGGDYLKDVPGSQSLAYLLHTGQFPAATGPLDSRVVAVEEKLTAAIQSPVVSVTRSRLGMFKPEAATPATPESLAPDSTHNRPKSGS